jgi:hypothetical protein
MNSDNDFLEYMTEDFSNNENDKIMINLENPRNFGAFQFAKISDLIPVQKKEEKKDEKKEEKKEKRQTEWISDENKMKIIKYSSPAIAGLFHSGFDEIFKLIRKMKGKQAGDGTDIKNYLPKSLNNRVFVQISGMITNLVVPYLVELGYDSYVKDLMEKIQLNKTLSDSSIKALLDAIISFLVKSIIYHRPLYRDFFMSGASRLSSEQIANLLYKYA